MKGESVRRIGVATRWRTEGTEAESAEREASQASIVEGGVKGLTLKSTTCSTICPLETAAEVGGGADVAADIFREIGNKLSVICERSFKAPFDFKSIQNIFFLFSKKKNIFITFLNLTYFIYIYTHVLSAK